MKAATNNDDNILFLNFIEITQEQKYSNIKTKEVKKAIRALLVFCMITSCTF